ncbi:unnamed protein product [Hydatigera taeniaeformis]|uniref:Secreted protein n=1 Tax=Hydatigena taeniaeformis TaxID=6205 RepID=A0A0R3WHM3_HYDTA|nr:unnamed protein product [Hydatigera taeniaeformis]
MVLVWALVIPTISSISMSYQLPRRSATTHSLLTDRCDVAMRLQCTAAAHSTNHPSRYTPTHRLVYPKARHNEGVSTAVIDRWF